MRYVKLLLILSILTASAYMLCCAGKTEQELNFTCPASKYKLTGKDMHEAGWFFSDFKEDEYSSEKYILKDYNTILEGYALCSYKGLCANAKTGEGYKYYIYIYPNKRIAAKILEKGREMFEEKFSLEDVNVGNGGFKIGTVLGDLAIIRYGNAIIVVFGAGDVVDFAKIITDKMKKVESEGK